jgi:excisionase family DNA binding protein
VPSDLAPLPNWLSTSETAEFLGVHANTIRRWADAGRLPAMITPGGHRRFALDDLRAFEWRQRQEAHAQLKADWTRHALSITRNEIATRRGASWLQAYDDAARKEQRDLGRRLLGLILRFVSGDSSDQKILKEVETIGRQHAETARRLGLSMADAMQASLFFRDRVIETAFGLTAGDPMPGGVHGPLFDRLTKLLNVYQLAVLDGYEAGP